MRSYFEERKFEKDLIGISISFDKGWTMDGISQVKISFIEFQELKKEANLLEVNDKKEFKILSDLWVKKHNYKRLWLKE